MILKLDDILNIKDAEVIGSLKTVGDSLKVDSKQVGILSLMRIFNYPNNVYAIDSNGLPQPLLYEKLEEQIKLSDEMNFTSVKEYVITYLKANGNNEIPDIKIAELLNGFITAIETDIEFKDELYNLVKYSHYSVFYSYFRMIPELLDISVKLEHSSLLIAANLGILIMGGVKDGIK
jgi:hypothetical protein